MGDLAKHYQSHSKGWDDHLYVLGKQVAESVAAKKAPPIDWTRFHLYVAIETAPERVFQAWATSKGMESFLSK